MINIPFHKMNGLGNDFVIIDARQNQAAVTASDAQAISDRLTGVGCDTVVIIEPSVEADLSLRFMNADGSTSKACGNAVRCIASLMLQQRLRMETGAGIVHATRHGNGAISVDMGEPRFGWQDIPLAKPSADTRMIELTHRLKDGRVLQDPSAVSMGNPHCIFFVADVDSYNLAGFGPELENHAMFPQRANISVAEILSGSEIKLRVWERGAGLTKACGTAACATVAAAVRMGKTGREARVHLPGGALEIRWQAEDGHIIMTGPAEHEFDGFLHLQRYESGSPSVTYEIAA